MTSPPPHPLHLLRPRSPGTASEVVHRDDVSPLAWAGLHLDGLLVPLWHDVSRPVHTPEGPSSRAAALAHLVPARGALARRAAAWVHTGGPAPDRVDVLVPARARRPAPHPVRRAFEGALGDDEVVTLAGVRVTTVRRTAVDVARWVPGDVAAQVLHALLAAGLDPHEALDALAAAGPGRGVRAARRVLGALVDRRVRTPETESTPADGPAESPDGRADSHDGRAGSTDGQDASAGGRDASAGGRDASADCQDGSAEGQARIAGSSAPREPVMR